jgi:predicted permease
MDFFRSFLSRIAALFGRKQQDAEFDEELRVHIDLLTSEYIGKGMPPTGARTAALRSFGGLTQTREAWRLRRGMPLFSQIARDTQFAVRQLRHSPGFSLTAILTLALGIGAVTSVFSVINTVLLKPFSAFRDPDRLIVLRESETRDTSAGVPIPDNYLHWVRLRRTTKSLEDTALFQQFGVSVSPNGEHPHIVGGLSSSPNFLRVLGVEPIYGRDFVDSDAVKGAPDVAILSYIGWQSLLGGDPHVIGRTLRVNDVKVSIIGVLPAGMRFPEIAVAPSFMSSPTASDERELMIYQPFIPSPEVLKQEQGGYNYKSIARLKPGITLAQATAELNMLQHAYTISSRSPISLGIALTPLQKDAASQISGALWLIFASVGAVLLIACVNLANLQLARAVTAEREMAVRAALGAGKTRLVMARLTESLILAIIGGIAGTALSFAGVRLFIALVPSDVPRLDEVHINLSVLAFAACISIAAAIAFGILPALRSLRVHPQAALQSNSSRATSARHSMRARSLLVAAQVACTVVLLLVTSLILRSFSNLLLQDRGFDASHVTLAQVDLFSSQYGDTKPNVQATKLALVDRSIAAIEQLPGVQSVAVTSAMPLTGQTWVDLLTRPDHPLPVVQRPPINVRWINPAYMTTMQMPLISGRNFTSGDRANPRVVLISERTAREGFPGENPVGRTIESLIPDDKGNMIVIGIVADARINGLKDDARMVYAPVYGFTPWTLSFLIRSTASSDALMPSIRRAIWSIDPQVAIPAVKSMDQQVSQSVATDRFQALVLTCFGAAALLLALLGVYGVQAYGVSLRRQEFGIRIAMGSSRAALIRLVLRQAASPILFGGAAGLVLAAAALWFIRSLLYQTPVTDPLALGVSVTLLISVATLAAVFPARRAARTDPIQALRTE